MDFSIGQNIIKNAFSILKDSKKHRLTSILPSQMIAVGSNPKSLNGQAGARPNPKLEIEDYNNNLTTQLSSYSNRLGALPETFSSSIPVTNCSGTENILKPRNPIPKSERRKQKPTTTTAVVCCGGKCKCSRCMNVPLEIAGVNGPKYDTKFNEMTEDAHNDNDTLDKNRIEMSKFKSNRLSKRNKQPPNLYEIHDSTICHHTVEKFEIPTRPQTTHPAQYQTPVISFIPLNSRTLSSNPDKMNNFSNQELLLRPKTACRLFVSKDSESLEDHKLCSYKQSSANKEPPYISSLLHPGYENRCPSKNEKLFWSSNGGCHNTESNAKFNKHFGSQFRLDGSMVKDFKISRPQHIEIPKYIRQASRGGQERNYQEQTMAANKRLRKKVIRTGVDLE